MLNNKNRIFMKKLFTFILSKSRGRFIRNEKLQERNELLLILALLVIVVITTLFLREYNLVIPDTMVLMTWVLRLSLLSLFLLLFDVIIYRFHDYIYYVIKFVSGFFAQSFFFIVAFSLFILLINFFAKLIV